MIFSPLPVNSGMSLELLSDRHYQYPNCPWPDADDVSPLVKMKYEDMTEVFQDKKILALVGAELADRPGLMFVPAALLLPDKTD
jgi:hypothetical protein